MAALRILQYMLKDMSHLGTRCVVATVCIFFKLDAEKIQTVKVDSFVARPVKSPIAYSPPSPFPRPCSTFEDWWELLCARYFCQSALEI